MRYNWYDITDMADVTLYMDYRISPSKNHFEIDIRYKSGIPHNTPLSLWQPLFWDLETC